MATRSTRSASVADIVPLESMSQTWSAQTRSPMDTYKMKRLSLAVI
jgi:hypothetical protein